MRNVPIIRVNVYPSALELKDGLNVSRFVLSLKYEDCSTKADKLEITVDNYDMYEFDAPLWRTGNKIVVSWGYDNAMSPPRTTFIRKISGFRVLKIEALGGELLLAVEQKTGVFRNLKHSEIVTKIANAWGYKDLDLLHIEETTKRYDTVNQGGTAGMTDQQLVQRLADENGFIWYIDHDGFHWHKREYAKATAKVLTYFSDKSPTEILDINLDIDVTRRAGSVERKGWNPKERKGIDFNAQLRTEAQKDALREILEAPGMGEWDVPGMELIGHHDKATSPHSSVEEIIREARASVLDAQSAAVKMKVTTVGDPTILGKSVVEILGIGKRLSGRYFVKQIDHEISAKSGYTCKLQLTADGSNGGNLELVLPNGISAIQPLPSRNGKPYVPPSEKEGIQLPDDPSTGKPFTREAYLAYQESKGKETKTPEGSQRAADKPAPNGSSAAQSAATANHASAAQKQAAKTAATKQAAIAKETAAEKASRLQRPADPDTEGTAHPNAPLPGAPTQAFKQSLGAVAVPEPSEAEKGAQQKALDTKGYVPPASKKALEDAYDSTAPGLPLKVAAASSPPPANSEAAVNAATLEPRPDFWTPNHAVRPGNIDLDNRPYATFPDGSFGTVKSMSFEEHGVEVLIPTIADDGTIMSGDQAIEYYHQTGKHLGVFLNPTDATKASIEIHLDQAANPPVNTLAPRLETRLTDTELEQLMLQDPQ